MLQTVAGLIVLTVKQNVFVVHRLDRRLCICVGHWNRRIYDIMNADALIKQLLQIEHKLAKENAETNGWNVADERAAVTE